MRQLLFFFCLLISVQSVAQTVKVDLPDVPLKSLIGKTIKDSGTYIVSKGNGYLFARLVKDSLIVKSFIAKPGIRISENDTSIFIERQENFREVKTPGITVFDTDENILYSGGAGVIVFPNATLNPNKSFTITNRSASTTSLTSSIGFTIQGRRVEKYVSVNGVWRKLFSFVLTSNF